MLLAPHTCNIKEEDNQCCGSGSVGSIFLDLSDPDPLARDTDPDPSTIKQKCLNSEKNIDSHCYVSSLRLLIFEK
jgi:hypothetical protein